MAASLRSVRSASMDRTSGDKIPVCGRLCETVASGGRGEEGRDMDTIVDYARDKTEHLDVLIVGAGLSGIGAAWHLQDKCKGKSYAILEARDSSGGTWDL